MKAGVVAVGIAEMGAETNCQIDPVKILNMWMASSLTRRGSTLQLRIAAMKNILVEGFLHVVDEVFDVLVS